MSMGVVCLDNGSKTKALVDIVVEHTSVEAYWICAKTYVYAYPWTNIFSRIRTYTSIIISLEDS